MGAPGRACSRRPPAPAAGSTQKPPGKRAAHARRPRWAAWPHPGPTAPAAARSRAAGFNQLVQLPEELAHCRALRTLDLRNNKIASLPNACCTLELSLLDLTNNSIRCGPHPAPRPRPQSRR
jgi:hypothetical protein